jgi:hypothetical protein
MTMTEHISKREVGGFTVTTVYDRDPLDPREDAESGDTRLHIWWGRYDLGDDDKPSAPEGRFTDLAEALTAAGFDPKADLWLPVYVYEHGIIRVKVGSFRGLLAQGHAEFDSGMAGYIAVRRDDWLDRYNADRTATRMLTKKRREEAVAYLTDEVSEYDSYLIGDCYGFIVTNTKTGDVAESCYGWLGDEPGALDEGVRMAEWYETEARRARQERVKKYIRHDVPLDKRLVG